MVKRYESVGSGMTRKKRVWYDGEDAPAVIKKTLRGWNEQYKRGNGAYGAVALAAVEWAKSVISSAPITGVDSSDDTPEGFAQRILTYDKIIRKCIADGKCDSAARFAFQLGEMCGVLEMKHEWERLLIPAEKFQAGNRKAADARRKSDRDVGLARRFISEQKKNPRVTQKEMAYKEGMPLDAYKKALGKGREIIKTKKKGNIG